MPCNSDYMTADEFEINLSRVYQLLDELNGGTIDERAWEGYDNRVYGKNRNKSLLDEFTSKLCNRLKKVDVKKYSLELQMWWREHQKADKLRLENEKKEKKEKELRENALAKLSKEEKEALGL